MREPAPWIVVHVPKTAGTSLRGSLREHFGDGLLVDDGDRPLMHARWRRRGAALARGVAHAGRPAPAACVIGHFLAIKYRWARGARFAIWVRDPVARVLSRYGHYQRDVASGDASHAARGLVPGLTLAQFLAIPNYRDTMAEYLWGFPLERFDFIGSVEHFDADLERFSRVWLQGAAVTPRRANVGRDARESAEVDSGMASAIRAANARDVLLHDAAMALRRRQIAEGR